MKHKGGDEDSELYEQAKKMTREEMMDLAEELERRAVIFRRLACDSEFVSNPWLSGHLRRFLDSSGEN